MSQYIGNTNNIVHWQDIILSLEKKTPAYVGPRHTDHDPIIGIIDIFSGWRKAGYVLAADGGTCGWDMFFVNTHFDQSIVDSMSEFLKIKPVSAWISRVNPGMFAPWHWDANDSEELYSALPDMVRFNCFISNKAPGHSFIVDNICIHDYQQGDVYQWSSRKSWHAGANFGYTPKYVFNIFGNKLET